MLTCDSIILTGYKCCFVFACGKIGAGKIKNKLFKVNFYNILGEYVWRNTTFACTIPRITVYHEINKQKYEEQKHYLYPLLRSYR